MLKKISFQSKEETLMRNLWRFGSVLKEDMKKSRFELGPFASVKREAIRAIDQMAETLRLKFLN